MVFKPFVMNVFLVCVVSQGLVKSMVLSPEVSTATQMRSMATILGSKYATTYFDSNYGSSVRKRYANSVKVPKIF